MLSSFHSMMDKHRVCAKDEEWNIWLQEGQRVVVISQIRSVAQSCPTLCDPMNRSTPGLPVHHQLPEFTQTHVHRVSDAIQPSHPLSSPSPLAPNLAQHQSLFQWVNSSHEVAKVLEFQHQLRFFQRNPRADLVQNGLVESPCSPRDSQESSPTPQFKSINSSVLSFLHSPTLNILLQIFESDCVQSYYKFVNRICLQVKALQPFQRGFK